ncbi:PhoH family protein [Amphiplicatus metriothermophilus]|uniref:PhoH-like protein n=1 Tax=Amphiplicatus metriothermophilus TaxID=1519374 RepID=A0A239PQ29_9PROT|nr:PhoH family protein [Amphiplicatus metriothermophilus]MBB5518793.1 phosphate starvation-inducible PhoH-like protein [Amphiplicatus metriothermophilus]SNT72052.1 phosphate starvation-inducible protein PhoH [Amphiplicatus metriothermophilus]
MAKRSARRALRRVHDAYGQIEGDNVRRLFDDAGWSPLNDAQREQKYRKNIRAQNDSQRLLLEALDAAPLVFAVGAAGTGKTYLAVAKAVEALEAGEVRRIVLSRPAVEAGESLGFLPGDLEDKMSPYLRPLYDALCDRLSHKRLKALMAEGVIEIAPIAYMRGRTLNNAFVVIDEAQNCTYAQLKMLLTRLGWNSRMVVTGDPAQSDLLPGMSGLEDILVRLDPLASVTIVRFTRADVVRHPVVAEIIEAL